MRGAPGAVTGKSAVRAGSLRRLGVSGRPHAGFMTRIAEATGARSHCGAAGRRAKVRGANAERRH